MASPNAVQSKARTATTNLAGGVAYIQDAKSQIVALLLTSFLEDKFYESAASQLERIQTLVRQEPDFSRKAAVYARKVFGMRSISQVVAAEVAACAPGTPGIRKMIADVCQRPDDMAGIVAYYRANHGEKLPSSIIKGLRLAFDNFSTYQLLKYKMETRDWKMVDIINVVRPRFNEFNQAAIKALVSGTEAEGASETTSADTWEVAMNKARALEDKDEAKEAEAAEWMRLIAEDKLGYMALLRNLGRIYEYASDDVLATALERIQDPERVAKSRQFPYRFYTAIKVLREGGKVSGEVLGAIATALDHSVANIPKFPGKTLVAIDTSGSMSGGWGLSQHSVACPAEIAALFGCALAKVNDVDVCQFGTTAEFETLNPNDSVAGQMDYILGRQGRTGHGTSLSAPLEIAGQRGTRYDRIIWITDMQGWYGGGDEAVRALNHYKVKTNGDPWLYNIDLAGHGTTKFPSDGGRYIQFAGFSDKVFTLFPMIEKGMDATVQAVEAYEG